MNIKYLILFIILIFSGFVGPMTWAAETVVDIHMLTPKGTGIKIGTVSISKTAYGTLFTPNLSGLSEGLHGFHVHANGSCDAAKKNGKTVPGLAAGGHFDPARTDSHQGPYGNGHLGDLPALYSDAAGIANHPVLAPRIRPADLQGHALIIHQGGDNYSDTPAALGGGGARVACGIIK